MTGAPLYIRHTAAASLTCIRLLGLVPLGWACLIGRDLALEHVPWRHLGVVDAWLRKSITRAAS